MTDIVRALTEPQADKHEGLDPKAVEAASRAIREGGSYEVMAQAAIRAYLAASAPVPAEPVRLVGEDTDRVRTAIREMGKTTFRASELIAYGVKGPTRKQIYNALTYLSRTGELTRLGYGEYSVANLGNTHPAPNRDELIAALEHVRDVITRLSESGDHWWIDVPDRGGFDVDRIERALRESMEKQG